MAIPVKDHLQHLAEIDAENGFAELFDQITAKAWDRRAQIAWVVAAGDADVDPFDDAAREFYLKALIAECQKRNP